MVQVRFPQSALSQFPSDFKKAYKQIPAEPIWQALLTPWLPWLALLLRIVWMTSLLSTEKTTIFSRWLVWRVLAAGCT